MDKEYRGLKENIERFKDDLTDEKTRLLFSIAYKQGYDKALNMEGKCPKDDRENRPVFITYKNKKTLAMADGKGHAYKMYGDDYMQLESKCLPENKYDPSEYEFDRGLSGFDF